MSISRDDIERLARLAHLDLAPGEGERLATDLAAILDYVDRIPPLEAGKGQERGETGAAPFRDDDPAPPIPPGIAVAPAPERVNDLFKVPPAFGGA